MAFSSIKHGVKRHGLRAQKGELLSSNTAATDRHPNNLTAQQTDPRALSTPNPELRIPKPNQTEPNRAETKP